jgi:hypothetical protein
MTIRVEQVNGKSKLRPATWHVYKGTPEGERRWETIGMIERSKLTPSGPFEWSASYVNYEVTRSGYLGRFEDTQEGFATATASIVASHFGL